MSQEHQPDHEIDRFIVDEIDSVPHLEALLLFWNSRPKHWSIVDMSKALYLSDEQTGRILEDLARRKLIEHDSDQYRFSTDPELAELIERVSARYRRELVRVSNMIHSKASPSVREFARAFRFKKD